MIYWKRNDAYFTPLHTLKQPPSRPSPAAILRLTTKLELLFERLEYCAKHRFVVAQQ